VLFMVVETFAGGDMVPIYRHMAEKGRGLPDGVEYVDSWVSIDMTRCFQLMRADDAAKLQQWVLHWRGLGVGFEFVPVVPAKDTRALHEKAQLA
jgi:hypothetical protein